MYSTCLFCHSSLGSNDVVEHFPVGRRLAFDAAKGRLWVVCRHCERWNLTPLEERWEAIEECEKLFRATTLRMSTEHIGLARVREGLELVRIGNPQRPEMAAWRYGDQFGKRRLRYWAYGAAGAVAIGALVAGGIEVGVLAGGGFNIAFNLINTSRNLIWSRRTVAYVPTPNGSVRVQRGHLPSARITRSSDGEMVLQFDRKRYPGEPSTRVAFRETGYIRRRGGLLAVTGRRVEIPLEQSAPALAALMPAINAKGGTRQTVSSAVDLLETRGTDGLLRDAAAARPAAWNEPRPGQLSRLPAELRLALEMATHEDQERAALEGELKALEERWREAEEIASIADDLFVEPSVNESLDELKDRVAHEVDADGGNSGPPQGTNR
jgi:hypothetical protein